MRSVVKRLLKILFVVQFIVLHACQGQEDGPVPATLAIRAADLSFTPEIELAETEFYDAAGKQKNLVELFKEAGCNVVRLRLWHSPATGHSGLTEVAAFAARLQAMGFKIWLDIHYSDTWADPGTQVKPAAWQGLDLATLQDSVYAYTETVLARITPEYVQLGNEINNGFLWDDGSITNEQQFMALLKEGVKATREAVPEAQIIIHFAGFTGTTSFYQLLADNQLDYDIIGLSYYPWWHGKDLAQLQAIMAKLTSRFAKPLVLAEVSYPFTLNWNDNTHNIIGLESQLLSDYPATPAGQEAYLERIREMMIAVDDGLGFCYWAPDWVAFRGPTATDGSAWENQALFDFDNKVLPGMKVFRP